MDSLPGCKHHQHCPCRESVTVMLYLSDHVMNHLEKDSKNAGLQYTEEKYVSPQVAFTSSPDLHCDILLFLTDCPPKLSLL